MLGLRPPLDEARPGRPKQVAPRAALPLHMYRLLVRIGATGEEIAQLDPAPAPAPASVSVSASARLAEFYHHENE